ncbi:MAG: hypothetical protein PHT41_05140 [Candidatus Omnitrophica bacterium]|nr:hypothetical protein [Candidatus Omnitrophota bacterium]MDD5238319.1 hypothetical protein [Candidatus Omnitrophota bacterium]
MNSKKGLLKIGFLVMVFSLAMLLLSGECVAASLGGVIGGGASPGDTIDTDPSGSPSSDAPASMEPTPPVPDIQPEPQPEPPGGDSIGSVSITASGLTSLQVETATRAADVANRIPDAAQFVQDKELRSGANIHFQDQFVAPMPLPGDNYER